MTKKITVTKTKVKAKTNIYTKVYIIAVSAVAGGAIVAGIIGGVKQSAMKKIQPSTISVQIDKASEIIESQGLEPANSKETYFYRGVETDRVIPFAGYFNNDEYKDLGYYNRATQEIYFHYNNSGRLGNKEYITTVIPTILWGVARAGDFDGDHLTDLAIWAPKEGYWYVLFNKDKFAQGTVVPVTFEKNKEYPLVPLAGDVDGDGDDDLIHYITLDEGKYFTYMESNNGSFSIHKDPIAMFGILKYDEKPFVMNLDDDNKVDLVLYRGGVTRDYYFYYALSTENYKADDTNSFSINGNGTVNLVRSFVGSKEVGTFQYKYTPSWYIQNLTSDDTIEVDFTFRNDMYQVPLYENLDNTGNTDLILFDLEFLSFQIKIR